MNLFTRSWLPLFRLFIFSDAWNHIKWYGRGPWENYADRKTSAFVGTYESTVQEQHVPYVVPVECGGKEDVRNEQQSRLRELRQPALLLDLGLTI